MTLEQLFKHGQQAAKMLFEKQGEVLPMWIAEDASGKVFPIPVLMTNKAETAARVKEALHQLDAVRYVSLLEAWTIEAKELPESLLTGGSLASHPDRREIIAITAEEKFQPTISGHFYILRPEHGKARLSAFKRLSTTHHEGRFVGLLS